MKNSIRSLALMSVLVLAAQPMLAAEGGSNPFPRSNLSMTWMLVASTVLSVFGF
jgi:hypothetical protein